MPPNEPDANIVALDDALKALAEVDDRKSRVVVLRFFGGLSIEETAQVFGGFAGNGRKRLETGKDVAAERVERGKLKHGA